ncbi:MAG: hypothetical protein CML42_10335 [Rhodobacteraceae bacterium]|nr:hypothetical protein [Paracoccaceae bacterium]|tara:strand:- start:1026 stop:1673 length:648 start_codon:yes stop_codon:yes gene_type:complete
MSETLTLNETPADQPELNSDEQESLAIAEANEGSQQQLLAGKFDSTQSLEKAYLELQKKLGEPKEEESTDNEPTEESEEAEESEESDEAEVAEGKLTEEQAQQLYKMVGGEKAYQTMLDWASQSLSKEEVEMYDSVMADGNANSIYFAVQALSNKYSNAVGSEGQLLTGRGSTESKAVFRSQSELVQAMNDPRYDNDPAYRSDVMAKLENSDLGF